MNGKNLVEKQEKNSLMITDLKGKLEIAGILLKSQMLPKGFSRPEQVLISLLWGDELGVSPMVAINNISSINGKPTLSTDLMIGIAKNSPGYAGMIIDSKPDSCTVTIKRKIGDIEEVFSNTFTIEEARTAGLTGKDNWKKYPARMLKHRATSYACRDAFPDVLAGMYTMEEMGADTVRNEVVQVEAEDITDAPKAKEEAVEKVEEKKEEKVQPPKKTTKKATKKETVKKETKAPDAEKKVEKKEKTNPAGIEDAQQEIVIEKETKETVEKVDDEASAQEMEINVLKDTLYEVLGEIIEAGILIEEQTDALDEQIGAVKNKADVDLVSARFAGIFRLRDLKEDGVLGKQDVYKYRAILVNKPEEEFKKAVKKLEALEEK